MIEDKTAVASYCNVSRNPIRFKALNQADDVSARSSGGSPLREGDRGFNTF